MHPDSTTKPLQKQAITNTAASPDLAADSASADPAGGGDSLGKLLYTKTVTPAGVDLPEETPSAALESASESAPESAPEPPDVRTFDLFYLQSLSGEILPRERVAGCMRLRINRAKLVSIWHDPARMRAWYGNLAVCGSVWHCAVCSTKVAEGRRRELTTGLASARMQGFYPLLVTYTLQHKVIDSLAYLLGGLLDAIKRTKAGKGYKLITKPIGLIGTIGALEVTWGHKTGWHPHKHEIWLVDHEPTDRELEALQQLLSERYLRYLTDRGFWASSERGVKIDFDRKDPFKAIGEYVSKFGRLPKLGSDLDGWTVASELTKAMVKKAGTKGEEPRYNPFQLLALSEVSNQAKALFMEYAYAFKGRKQLTYSPGVREILSVPIATDQELAEDLSDYPVLLALLTPRQWSAVLAAEARAKLLREARSGDPARVLAFLVDLGVGPE